MPIYAIGDVRGEHGALNQLLDKLHFEPSRDRLWFSGNLINSGSDSLAVLRQVKALGRSAIVVLGSEELRLLGVAAQILTPTADDQFAEILAAPDREELLKWLRQRPLLHYQDKCCLVHAGIPAEWSLSQAQTYAFEAESSLSLGSGQAFLENLFTDEPTRWHAKHRGWNRARFIVNAFTRMQFFNDKGRFTFGNGGTSIEQPPGHLPWFLQQPRALTGCTILFGHRPIHSESLPAGYYALDHGCGQGGTLSALRLGATADWINLAADVETIMHG